LGVADILASELAREVPGHQLCVLHARDAGSDRVHRLLEVGEVAEPEPLAQALRRGGRQGHPIAARPLEQRGRRHGAVPVGVALGPAVVAGLGGSRRVGHGQRTRRNVLTALTTSSSATRARVRCSAASGEGWVVTTNSAVTSSDSFWIALAMLTLSSPKTRQ